MGIHPGIIVLSTCKGTEKYDIQQAALDYDDFHIAILMDSVEYKKQKKKYGVLVAKCHLMYFSFLFF
jgi:hypothetical protein